MLSISLWDALARIWPVIKLLAVIAIVVAIRLVSILPGRQGRPSKKRSPSERCSTALFLGSGGHTTELLLLLRSLDPQRYTPRSYFVSSGDDFSRKKAVAFEQEWAATGESTDATAAPSSYTIVTLPRARAVHQSWLSTPISTALCFVACAPLFVLPQLTRRSAASTRPPELVIMNGPGTCVPLVAAIYVNRMLSLPSPRLIYVESFARVKSLSLTARLLRPFVDNFVVQWEDAVGTSGRQAQCRGWLV